MTPNPTIRVRRELSMLLRVLPKARLAMTRNSTKLSEETMTQKKLICSPAPASAAAAWATDPTCGTPMRASRFTMRYRYR